ncbi:hypothetical protein [Siminovitchia fortis]|uniref:Secreted protein n=1 Tax=Siminovitchia fortis TaxID=254758 RepID=A0A443IU78_9BACI|nr:hypothetical protein [Siminovitchia fortis]RWR11643.1 hypothetical protein D4N35_008265 [Siminovitchia fortis]WHY83229.1 hypothetical protein QNH23_07610 [Siminovitchia fortis]
MNSSWKRGLTAFSILLLAACSPAQETALIEHPADNQEKVIESDQNIGDHPAWNDSPAEPEIGEGAIEVPPNKEDD